MFWAFLYLLYLWCVEYLFVDGALMKEASWDRGYLWKRAFMGVPFVGRPFVGGAFVGVSFVGGATGRDVLPLLLGL